MKTVYIIHGWGGSPQEAMHVWLKRELEARGYSVVVPEMPDTAHPVMEKWIPKLKEVVVDPANSIMVGHSIGCQTILRWTMDLPAGQQVPGTVFIAPWLTLTLSDDEEPAIAEPWLTTPIDDAAVRAHLPRLLAIFSDNDPYVPMENVEVFAKRFGAVASVEHGKGHFTEDDGVDSLPAALDAVLAI